MLKHAKSWYQVLNILKINVVKRFCTKFASKGFRRSRRNSTARRSRANRLWNIRIDTIRRPSTISWLRTTGSWGRRKRRSRCSKTATNGRCRKESGGWRKKNSFEISKMQYIVTNTKEYEAQVLKIFEENFVQLSCNKFASNVIEKVIKSSKKSFSEDMITRLSASQE